MRFTKQQRGSGKIAGSDGGLGRKQGEEISGHKLEMENLIGSMTLVLQQPDMDIEELEGRVWSELPDELVDRVLACLPIPLLLQLRCLCKRWNYLITSAPFLKLQAAAPYSGPHFLVFELQKPNSWGAYDARLQKWYTVPLDPLEGEIVMSMASDGGLLCKVVRSNWMQGPTCIVLSNPVTKCRRKLPMTGLHLTPTWIPSLVVLVVDQARNSFKVVVAGSKGCPHGQICRCRVTEVYDSISDRWETTGNLPFRYVLLDPPSYVVCGGHIYCIASRFEEDFSLVAYDLERKMWKEISLEMPTFRKSQLLLFERRGSLVLVQLAGGCYGVPEIYTWQPGCPAAGEWSHVNVLQPRTSRHSVEELFRADPDLACGGKGDLIFFVSHKYHRAWLYDMSHRTWTITPESRFLKLDHKPPLLAVPFDFNLQLLCS